MVNTRYFDKDINTETVQELVEKLSSMEGKIDLWFSTSGGFTNQMYYLINYLNSRKEDIKITLTNECLSCGTFLLVYFDGEITHFDLEVMLFHVTDRERYCLRDNKWINSDKLQKQDWKQNKKFAKKLLERNILTEKQVNRFLKGQDVIIYEKEIKKIFKNEKA